MSDIRATAHHSKRVKILLKGFFILSEWKIFILWFHTKNKFFHSQPETGS